MNILALDLGTTTGFAMSIARKDGSKFESSGVFKLATAKELKAESASGRNRTRDIRVVRLATHLEKLTGGIKFDLVIFEDVKFSVSTAQTQLWSSFRTAVWLMADAEIVTADTARLKKFATNHGGANKEMMATAFKRWFPGRESVDDNERDAVFLLELAKKYTEQV